MIQGFPTPQKDYYKVYVRSITYNQSQYIEDCLNGVAIQETDFPFVHHVIDDCSTDGEQDVIKTWIKRECDNAEYYDNDLCTITLAKHKSNPNYTIAAYFLKRNMYRERAEKEKLYTLWRETIPYEALCEGDDYWTDPLKLNKQISFLDKNPDYSLCFHQALEVWETKSKNSDIFAVVENRDYQSVEIYREWIIATASVLFRTEITATPLYKQIKGNKKIIFGDTPLFLTCSRYGKLRGMSDTMSVYRRQENGVTQAFNTPDPTLYTKLYIHKYELYRIFIDGNFPFKDALIEKYIHPILSFFIRSIINGRKWPISLFLYSLKSEPILTIKELIKAPKWYLEARRKYIRRLSFDKKTET